MEILHNGFTLDIPQCCFPLSTDSIALSGFVRLSRQAKILDLGAGCGTLGLLLCAKDNSCSVTGIELDITAHEAALRNIAANDLTARLKSICADLSTIPAFLSPGSFSCCVSNPPYFSGGPQSKTVPAARHQDTCTMDTLMEAAAWALKFGGDFFLVHKPERFAELCACASRNQLEPKRVCLLRHRADGPVALILVQCRKGAKPGLIWEEACLFDASGAPTEYHKQLYHS